jgi:hypothetical protein
LGTFKKDAFKPVFSKTFFDGEPVANLVEIFLDIIDRICLQKRANLKNFLLIHPNIAGFTTTAVAGTVFTCTGIKVEIKPIPSYNINGTLI